MDSVSISQLKAKPAQIINQSLDYPVAVASRNQVKAYLIGKNLYEKITGFIENYLDTKAVKKARFSSGKNFEKFTDELGI
ncbi:type II toxin-antitoxin system Phd/YefM family antitoxin [Patescibacteria group bacterium]